MKIRTFAALLVALLSPVVAEAACNPPQASQYPNSVGCQPNLGAPQAADLVLGWRPSLYPGSSGTFTWGQLSSSDMSNATVTPTGSTTSYSLANILAGLAGTGSSPGLVIAPPTGTPGGGVTITPLLQGGRVPPHNASQLSSFWTDATAGGANLGAVVLPNYFSTTAIGNVNRTADHSDWNVLNYVAFNGGAANAGLHGTLVASYDQAVRLPGAQTVNTTVTNTLGTPGNTVQVADTKQFQTASDGSALSTAQTQPILINGHVYQQTGVTTTSGAGGLTFATAVMPVDATAGNLVQGVNEPQMWASVSEMVDSTNYPSSRTGASTGEEFHFSTNNLDDGAERIVTQVGVIPNKSLAQGGYPSEVARVGRFANYGGSSRDILRLDGPFSQAALDLRNTSIPNATIISATPGANTSNVTVSDIQPFTSNGLDQQTVSPANPLNVIVGNGTYQVIGVQYLAPQPGGAVTSAGILTFVNPVTVADATSGNVVSNPNRHGLWMGTDEDIAFTVAGDHTLGYDSATNSTAFHHSGVEWLRGNLAGSTFNVPVTFAPATASNVSLVISPTQAAPVGTQPEGGMYFVNGNSGNGLFIYNNGSPVNILTGGSGGSVPTADLLAGNGTNLVGLTLGAGLTRNANTINVTATGINIPTATLLGGNGSLLVSRAVGSGLSFDGTSLYVTTPYNPAAVAITGGSIAGTDDSNALVTAAGTGPVAVTNKARAGFVRDVRSYGAVCDATILYSGVRTTSGSAVISSPAYSFTAADIGAHIALTNPAPYGANTAPAASFVGTITGASSGNATLSATVSFTSATAQYASARFYHTMDTTAIQAALDDQPRSAVEIPAMCATGTLTVHSGNAIVGPDEGVGTLMLASGINGDLLKGENFASLTGTGSLAGVKGFYLQNIQLDGNRGANTGSGAGTAAGTGAGLRIYGPANDWDNVTVAFFAGDGVYSEWANSTSMPLDGNANSTAAGPEAHIAGLRAFYNAGNGIVWNGPRRSIISQFSFAYNGAAGLLQGPTAAGAPLTLGFGHAYGNATYDVSTAQSGLSVVNAHLDGSVLLRSNTYRLIGSSIGTLVLGLGGDTVQGLSVSDSTIASLTNTAGTGVGDKWVNSAITNFTSGPPSYTPTYVINTANLSAAQGSSLKLANGSNTSIFMVDTSNNLSLANGGTVRLYMDTNGHVNMGAGAPITGTSWQFGGDVDMPASSYLNWGATDGTSGYGVRDLAGVMQVKNSGGSWTSILSASGSITFGGQTVSVGGSAAVQGNGAKIALATGTFTAGNVVVTDASGNLIDGAATPGGGSGSGSVSNSTAAGAFGVYTTAGTTISALPEANNAVAVTNGSGVAGLSTTLPSALTIPSPALTGTATAVNLTLSGVTTANGKMITAAPVTGGAGFNLTPGSVDPTTLVNGDAWENGSTLKLRMGSATKNVLTGLSGAINAIPYYGAAGTDLSSIPSVASSVLSTGTTGAPSFSNQLPAGIIAATFTTTGRLMSTNPPNAWGGNNYGSGFIVQSGTSNTNPAIGILDSGNSNPWAIVNTQGGLQIAKMPALTDTTTAPTLYMQFNDSTAPGAAKLNVPLIVPASTSGAAGFQLTPGAAPSATVPDGSMYVINAQGLFVQRGGKADGPIVGSQIWFATVNLDASQIVAGRIVWIATQWPYGLGGTLDKLVYTTGGTSTPSFVITAKINGSAVTGCSNILVNNTTSFVPSSCSGGTIGANQSLELDILSPSGSPDKGVIQLVGHKAQI